MMSGVVRRIREWWGRSAVLNGRFMRVYIVVTCIAMMLIPLVEYVVLHLSPG